MIPSSNTRSFISKIIYLPTVMARKSPLKAKGTVAGGGYSANYPHDKYLIVDPHNLHHGKNYSDWICDWFNWFLSADADYRNSGPVVFLRSRGLPNKTTNTNIPDVPSPEMLAGGIRGHSGEQTPYPTGYSPVYKQAYVNDPNVRVGGDRLKIYADQAVLVPIIIAYWLRLEASTDWGSMQDFTGLTIDYGDNPPGREQLTINGASVDLVTSFPSREGDQKKVDPVSKRGEERDMQDFRIVTPIFNAVVPDTQYGRSIKDFLEESPIEPGTYPAVVEGYFVMLRFVPGTYWVHSWASAPREVQGPYFSELLYEIEVSERRVGPVGRTTTFRPSRNERILNSILNEKVKIKDLTGPEEKQFMSYIKKPGGGRTAL